MAHQTRKELLSKVSKIIPPMLEHFHKGQLGRVAVIGGSEDYTGAPYFSAAASAKLGADMSHVICTPDAGAVIKTYSPNLMVHPYMRSSASLAGGTSAAQGAEEASGKIVDMLGRLHVVVIGPGLGRDECMQEICGRVVREARKRGLPVVLDADGLMLVVNDPSIVKGYSECILTPNVVEFGRLAKAVGMDTDDASKDKQNPTKQCEELAKALGGPTIIQKGPADNISNGSHTIVSDGEGGLKRSGGQGDTLTGCLATLLAYRAAYHDKLWDHDNDMSEAETLAIAAFGGSAITRECSRLAFRELGRSMQAGDLTSRVHEAYLDLIGEKTKASML